MLYEVVLSPQAVQDWRALPAHLRPVVRQALETYLRHAPVRTSRSRIKRLRGLSVPQYRLRVGEVRVFYDIHHHQVQVLAVVLKSQAQAWLDQQGVPDETGSAL